MATNIKEQGLETLIVQWLTAENGFEEGTNKDYNREYAIDETRLFRFLEATQPKAIEQLGVKTSRLKYEQFLNRLQGEIAKRGIIDVLRCGVKIYPASLVMFYMTPSDKNPAAQKLFAQNIFSVTRQLRYSPDATKLALGFVHLHQWAAGYHDGAKEPTHQTGCGRRGTPVPDRPRPQRSAVPVQAPAWYTLPWMMHG